MPYRCIGSCGTRDFRHKIKGKVSAVWVLISEVIGKAEWYAGMISINAATKNPLKGTICNVTKIFAISAKICPQKISYCRWMGNVLELFQEPLQRTPNFVRLPIAIFFQFLAKHFMSNLKGEVWGWYGPWNECYEMLQNKFITHWLEFLPLFHTLSFPWAVNSIKWVII